MKKIYTIIGILLLTSSVLLAQTPANRTANTIVADMLAQSPFDKPKDYNKSMEDLLSTKEEGVLQLVGMMKSPARGENAKIEYALSGLTHFAANKDEADRLAISNAYIKSLETTKERETLAFVIRQLELIAQDEAVDALAKFLSDESLSGPAARALSNIGTANAEAKLLNELRVTSSNKIKADVVTALGFMKAENAEEAIRSLINSDDAKLRRAAIQALPEVGSKASLKDLNNLAKKANYTLDPNGATGAYLNLIDKLINDGEAKESEKAAKSLEGNAKKASACGTRSAAFNLKLEANPAIAVKEAVNALKDDSRRFRLEALRAASRVSEGDALYKAVMAVYPKAKEDVRIDIAEWLVDEAQCPAKKDLLQFSVEPVIASLATTSSLDEQKVIGKLLVKLQNSSAIEPLINLLASDNEASVAIAKTALANMKGNIADPIASRLSGNSDATTTAMLELLGLRKSSKHLSDVIKLTNTGSADVKATAFNTLKSVVEAKDINSMYTLLESSDAQYVPAIQDAVIAALNNMPAEKRFDQISNKIAKTSDSKKHLYYTALAATKDAKALDIIIEGFNSNNKTQKDAAFNALTSWHSIAALDQLMAICKDASASNYFDRALDAYIKLGSSASTGENQLIYLRNAMKVAKTNEQKNTILKQVRKTGTFQGLIFAGKFLDDKAVQESAAQAVMNIALGNKNFTGPEVEALLNKVMDVLNNPDAGYQKESIKKHLREVPMKDGFVSMFNGKDLTGWKGLVADPIKRAKMSPAVLKREQAKADEQMRKEWYVEDECIVFEATGFKNLCTEKQYGDFEMYVDWKLDPAGPEADAGLYLRGCPQVQIWDTARVDVGAQVGSGGLYNNQVNRSTPLVVADNKLGEWNTFYIKMVGDRVTVYLNGILVVDNVILENLWDRSQPIPAIEQIELQAHGSKVYYRDLYIKELERVKPFELSEEEKKEGFEILFDGTNMHKWTGNTTDYRLEDGVIALHPSKGFGGNLYTKEQYSNFVYRFEFFLPPGANNGVGIRTPMGVDAAYHGMEIQILDHDNPIYSKITPLQVHGSVYGIIGAKRTSPKVNEWNCEEIIADGDNIKVTLNGEVILEGNIRDAVKNGTADGKEHPGLFNKSGHIGFLGHGNPVKFRNIRIKKLK